MRYEDIEVFGKGCEGTEGFDVRWVAMSNKRGGGPNCCFISLRSGGGAAEWEIETNNKNTIRLTVWGEMEEDGLVRALKRIVETLENKS